MPDARSLLGCDQKHEDQMRENLTTCTCIGFHSLSDFVYDWS